MGGALREVISLALIVGLVVTATAVLVLIVGNSGSHRSRPPARQLGGPPGPRPSPLGTTPSAAVAAARARALAAAAELVPIEDDDTASAGSTSAGPTSLGEFEPLALPPASPGAVVLADSTSLAASPAGQSSLDPDVPGGRLDPSTEELRSAIDRLIETNPDFLAEVITKWIHSDAGPTPGDSRPPSARRRPGPG